MSNLTDQQSQGTERHDANGRVSIAGMREPTLDALCGAFAAVLRSRPR